MAFEGTYSNAGAAPFIRLEALENLIQLRERLVEAGKYLLVRAYPGPLGRAAPSLFIIHIFLILSRSICLELTFSFVPFSCNIVPPLLTPQQFSPCSSITPSPPGQPLDAIGGMSSPHLPAHHPYPQPTTNLEVQQAMKDLLAFPLAVYLCAFHDPNVYLSYGMWYNIRQAVPCPNAPEDCQVKGPRYQQLELSSPVASGLPRAPLPLPWPRLPG